MIEQLSAYLAQGLSDPAIARLCGVSRSTIARARRALSAGPVGKPGRKRKSDKGEPKPHRPEEQPYRVRLLEDETVWAGLLAGQRYESADPGDSGPMRRLPAASSTGNSSMAHCGDW